MALRFQPRMRRAIPRQDAPLARDVEMSSRPSSRSRLISPACGLALLLLLAASFGLRTHFVYDDIFVGEQVRFSVHDPWCHVRLLENLVCHFPRQNVFDPYGVFPGGHLVPVAPLFDWLLALVILIVAWGDPSPRVVEVVAAYFPAVLGALTLIPVYFLGKHLFNRTAGLLAAGLITTSPGHFLGRSLLGYTDHHVAETLFSTTAMLLLVLALQHVRRGDVTLRSLVQCKWHLSAKVLICVLAPGLMTGMYLLTWVGGSMFVAIIAVYVLAQFILDHVTGRPTDYLPIVTLPLFLVSQLIVLPHGTDLVGFKFHFIALIGAATMTLVLTGLSKIGVRYRLPRAAFPLLTLAAGGLGLGILALVWPTLLRSTFAQFDRFEAADVKRIIPEAVPLLHVAGAWSLERAWEQFATGFFLSFPALVILCYRAVRRGETTTLLFCVWSVGMLAATLGQNRFAYYYAVNVALLSAYLGAGILHWIWGRLATRDSRIHSPAPRSSPGRRRAVKVSARRAGRPQTRGSGARAVKYAYLIGGGLGVSFLIFYPNIGLAIRRAGQAFTPHPDWLSAMRWMRENTPDPFGDPDAYFALYETPPNGEPYPYPESAYGVMTSWGYGYWIMRMGHRIPNANPGQEGARPAARFFTAQDEDSANAILDRLGSRYVVVDSSMPLLRTSPGGQVMGKIGSLAHWAGKQRESFFEVWYRRDHRGELQPFTVYYPDYYRMLLARLYVFRRQPVEPEEAYVMSFRLRINDGGKRYKELTSMSRFSTYGEAKAYLDKQESEGARIVGIDPHRSCVPIKRGLKSYRLVYRSPTVKGMLFGQPVSRVEIYEYLGYLRGRDAGGLEQR